jgi:hypothetical protein
MLFVVTVGLKVQLTKKFIVHVIHEIPEYEWNKTVDKKHL